MKKGISSSNRIGFWYCLLSLGLLFAIAPAAAVERIVVVKSGDNTYFNQTIDTLIAESGEAVDFEVISHDLVDRDFAYRAGKDLFVTLGQKAVESVLRLGTAPFAIHSYLTLEQYRSLGMGANQLTVLLDQPLRRYLGFGKLLLDPASIGILSPQPIEMGAAEEAYLAGSGLRVNQYHVDRHNKLLPVLRRLLRREDALLMLPRQTIFNRDTLKGVLLTSYRHRKPVISYSPAHVKSGALASIYSSPRDIGKHLARAVGKHLQQKGNAVEGFEFAHYYSIATNSRVAHALGLEIPSHGSLRERLEEDLQ